MSLPHITTTSQYNPKAASSEPKVAGNGMNPSSNDFLTMMVAQVQNQDPLNPTDGTEYLTQLGMMSAVESLEGVKTGLKSLNISMANVEMLQATSLVGKKVLMEANQEVDIAKGQVIEGRVQFDKAVDSAKVMVYDEDGKVVDEIKLGPQGAGMAEFQIDGDELDSGSYTFEVLAEKGDDAWSQKMMIAAEVESVNIPSGGGMTLLSLKGLGKMSMYDMREITA